MLTLQGHCQGSSYAAQIAARLLKKGLQRISHVARSYHGLTRVAQMLQALRLLVSAPWPRVQVGDLTCL